MGNEACCQNLRQENPIEVIQQMELKHTDSVIHHAQLPSELPEPVSEHHQPLPVLPAVAVPELPPAVKQALLDPSLSEYLNEKIESEATPHKYADDVYVGPVEESSQRPHGFGRMYKSDGSLYMGSFIHGKAEGLGAFVFPNGAYFQGQFLNNQASCDHGRYQAEDFRYTGGFRESQFEGKGYEESSRHSFEGEYHRGKRAKGTLKWREDSDFLYFYTGSFNENEKFHGQGVLAETRGVYEGEFVDGVKEGHGSYKGVNGVRYKGDYRGGIKEGTGTIYNSDDTLCYRGEFKNGLPHGKGSAFISERERETEWVEGIDRSMLKRVSQEE